MAYFEVRHDNSLRPKQNDHQIANHIVKYILLNEKFWMSMNVIEICSYEID